MQRHTGISEGSRVNKYARRPGNTFKDGKKRVQRVLELMAAKIAAGKDRAITLSDGSERGRLFETLTVPDHLRVLLQKFYITGDLDSPLLFVPQNPALCNVVKNLKVFGKDRKEVTYRLFGDEAGKGIVGTGNMAIGLHDVHVRQKKTLLSTGLLPAASPCQTLVLQGDYAVALSESIANHGLPQGDHLHHMEFTRVSLPWVSSSSPLNLSMMSKVNNLHLGMGSFGTQVAWIEDKGGAPAALSGQMLLDSLEAWMAELVRLIFPQGRRFSLMEGNRTYGLEVASPAWTYAKYGDAITFALWHPEESTAPFLEVSQIESRGSHQNHSEVIYAKKEGPAQNKSMGFSHLAMVPNTLALLDFMGELGTALYDPETMLTYDGGSYIYFAPTLLSAHLGQSARLGMPTMEHRISQCLYPGSHKQAYALMFCLDEMIKKWIAWGHGAVLGNLPVEIRDLIVGWFFRFQADFYQRAHLAAHARNFELPQ